MSKVSALQSVLYDMTWKMMMMMESVSSGRLILADSTV